MNKTFSHLWANESFSPFIHLQLKFVNYFSHQQIYALRISADIRTQELNDDLCIQLINKE